MAHATKEQIDARILAAGPSPRNNGTVAWICIRPAMNERNEVQRAEFTVEDGMVGDQWSRDLANGKAVPDEQVALMNSRYLTALAPDHTQALLAGDNLVVDFDLSLDNLNIGDRIAIGSEAVFEVTPEPHEGCAKFKKRFGDDALQWTKAERRRRGVYVRVVKNGAVLKGDTIRKVATTTSATPSRKEPEARRNLMWAFGAVAVVGIAAIVVRRLKQ